jgi:hypothetical protein
MLKLGNGVIILINFNLDKSLEELDGDNGGEPEYPSGLIHKCHNLRKKKLEEFTIEDLRVMIGQKDSLKYLVPLALKTLEINPFAAGDFYKGDLFDQVLRIEQDFWNQNTELQNKLNEIINFVNSKIVKIETVKIDKEERNILINDFVYVGGAPEPQNFCSSCKYQIYYYDKYDASFCLQCNRWIEDKCNDENCNYCNSRPMKPLLIMNV